MHQQHTPWGSANSQERTHLVLLTASFLLEHVHSFPKCWNNLSSGSLHILHGNTWIFTNVNLYYKFLQDVVHTAAGPENTGNLSPSTCLQSLPGGTNCSTFSLPFHTSLSASRGLPFPHFRLSDMPAHCAGHGDSQHVTLYSTVVLWRISPFSIPNLKRNSSKYYS